MQYTIIVNDYSYDLPPKTLAVMEELDEVLKVDNVKGLTVRQKFERVHNFTKKVFGEENAKEMLGSDNLNEIDLSELTLTIKKIVDAYDKPIADYEATQQAAKLNSLPIDKVIAIAKAAERIVTNPLQK